MIIRLSAKGRDLTAKLAASIETLDRFGPEWLAECSKAQRKYPGAILVRPEALPTDEQLVALWPVEIHNEALPSAMKGEFEEQMLARIRSNAKRGAEKRWANRAKTER